MATRSKPLSGLRPDHPTGRSHIKPENGAAPERSPLYNGTLSVSERLHLLMRDKGDSMKAVDFMEVYNALLPYQKYGLVNTGRSSTTGQPALVSGSVQTVSPTAIPRHTRSPFLPHPHPGTHRHRSPVTSHSGDRQHQTPGAEDARVCKLSQSQRRPVLSLSCRLPNSTGESQQHNASPGQLSAAPATGGQSRTASTKSRGSRSTHSLDSSPVQKPQSTKKDPTPADIESVKMESRTTQASPELTQLLDTVRNNSHIDVDEIVYKFLGFESFKSRDLNLLVAAIHERAVTDYDLAPALALFCARLKGLTAKLKNTDIKSELTFSSSLTQLCQKLFQEGPVDSGWTGYKSSGQDVREARNLHRHKFLGNVRFVGHLYLSGVMTESILHDCIDRLFKNRSAESVVCICQLLTVAGARLMEGARGEDVNIYLCKLQKLTYPRVREEVSSLITLQKNGWVVTPCYRLHRNLS